MGGDIRSQTNYVVRPRRWLMLLHFKSSFFELYPREEIRLSIISSREYVCSSHGTERLLWPEAFSETRG